MAVFAFVRGVCESVRFAKLGNVPSLLKISFVEDSGCGLEGDFVAEFFESADE